MVRLCFVQLSIGQTVLFQTVQWLYSAVSISPMVKQRGVTAVQLVFNPFSQLVPQLELYSQLQLSLWSDPIAFSVPKPT